MIINNINLKSTADDLETYQLSNIGQQSFKSDLIKVSDDLFTFNLSLKDGKKMIIPMRDDGYINATLLCKAGGKLFADYKRNKQTESYLQVLESVMGIPITQLIDIKQGNTSKYEQGTYVHRKVGIHLAQWINPYFSVQVSFVMEELLLFGKVELGKEKSNQELENKYQERILTLEREYDKLRQLHNSLKFKRNYHELEQGDCVYICHNKLEPPNRYKIGKTDNINKTLKVYRRNAPYTLLDYLFFTSKASLLENILLSRYIDERRPMNHEVVENIKLENIIEDIKKIVEFIKISGCESKDDSIKKYNNDINTPDIIVIEDEDDLEEKVVILEERVDIIEEKQKTDCKVIKDIEDNVHIITERMEIIEEKQKNNYEELLKDIEKYTDKKLKELLIEFKLPVSGLKDVKKQRLRSYINRDVSIVSDNSIEKIKSDRDDNYEEGVELDKLSVIELRRVCCKYGLKQEGLKNELIKRINSYLDNGDKEKHGLAKTVYKYDMNGNFIGEYESVKEASKSIEGETIQKIKQDRISDICLNKNGKSYMGFVWKYEKNEMTKEEVEDVNKHSRARVIIKENTKGEEIQMFRSIGEASRILNINLNTLNDALCKRGKYLKGDFVLKYGCSTVKQLTASQKIDIVKKYKDGVSVIELSKEYSKSVKQLRRVLN